MKSIPFHSEHLKLMDMRDYEKEKVYPYLSQAQLDVCSSIPHNYTFIHDGRIVTCIGLIALWPGVYEVWQIPSIYVVQNKILYAKTLVQLMEYKAKELNAHRFQTKSPADAFHDAWMEFAGFECDGILKGYTRFKEDYKMWSRRFQYGS